MSLMTPTTDEVSIGTFNILGSRVSSPERYTRCKREHCDPDKRMERFKATILKDFVNDGRIVCLQEVSRKQAKEIQEFLHSVSYDVNFCLYGKEKHDGMGIAICYPKDKFELYVIKMQKVSNLFDVPSMPIDVSLVGEDEVMRLSLESFRIAKQKINKIMLCGFKMKNINREEDDDCLGKDRCFWVSTWHGPCEFNNPSVMFIQNLYAKRWLMREIGMYPLIYAGDFNFSHLRKFCYEGAMKSHTFFDGISGVESPVPTTSYSTLLMDVYDHVNGKHPAYTVCGGQDEVFYGVLDRVFLRNGQGKGYISFIPKNATVGPSQEDGYIAPNEELSSDHLWLTCDFDIEEIKENQ